MYAIIHAGIQGRTWVDEMQLWKAGMLLVSDLKLSVQVQQSVQQHIYVLVLIISCHLVT